MQFDDILQNFLGLICQNNWKHLFGRAAALKYKY